MDRTVEKKILNHVQICTEPICGLEHLQGSHNDDIWSACRLSSKCPHSSVIARILKCIRPDLLNDSFAYDHIQGTVSIRGMPQGSVEIVKSFANRATTCYISALGLDHSGHNNILSYVLINIKSTANQKMHRAGVTAEQSIKQKQQNEDRNKLAEQNIKLKAALTGALSGGLNLDANNLNLGGGGSNLGGQQQQSHSQSSNGPISPFTGNRNGQIMGQSGLNIGQNSSLQLLNQSLNQNETNINQNQNDHNDSTVSTNNNQIDFSQLGHLQSLLSAIQNPNQNNNNNISNLSNISNNSPRPANNILSNFSQSLSNDQSKHNQNQSNQNNQNNQNNNANNTLANLLNNCNTDSLNIITTQNSNQNISLNNSNNVSINSPPSLQNNNNTIAPDVVTESPNTNIYTNKDESCQAIMPKCVKNENGENSRQSSVSENVGVGEGKREVEVGMDE